MTPKKLTTFRIDEAILQGLNEVKEKFGISVAEQVDHALLSWLEKMRVSSPVLEREYRMKHLETLTGVGDVSEEGGASIGRKAYHLTIWQEIHRVETMGGHREEIEGLKSVEGTIR